MVQLTSVLRSVIDRERPPMLQHVKRRYVAQPTRWHQFSNGRRTYAYTHAYSIFVPNLWPFRSIPEYGAFWGVMNKNND